VPESCTHGGEETHRQANFYPAGLISQRLPNHSKGQPSAYTSFKTDPYVFGGGDP